MERGARLAARGEGAFEIDERGLELGKRVHQTRHAIGMLEYGCLLVARLGINEAHLWQANRKSVHAATRRRLIRELKHTLAGRSEEHTSELQSLMRISYAVFCLKKKNN